MGRRHCTPPMPPGKKAFACEHVDRKLWARGLCKACYQRWILANNPDYAARYKKQKKGWAASKEGRAWRRKYMREWEKKNRVRDPEYQSRRNLKQYGLTVAAYEELLVKQGGGCAICQKPPGKKKLAVDHCHDTGAVRGLLCFRCNYGLSYFSDEYERVERVARYLERSKKAWREKRFGEIEIRPFARRCG